MQSQQRSKQNIGGNGRMKKIAIVGWGLFIFSVLLSGLLSWYFYEQGREDQYEEDYAVVAETITDAEPQSLSGEIVSTQNGRWTIETTQEPQHPLADSYPTTRIIEITPDTQFYERIREPLETYLPERNRAEREGVEPPSPYQEEVRTSRDFAQGDRVAIEPASDEFLYAENVTAQTVRKETYPEDE